VFTEEAAEPVALPELSSTDPDLPCRSDVSAAGSPPVSPFTCEREEVSAGSLFEVSRDENGSSDVRSGAAGSNFSLLILACSGRAVIFSAGFSTGSLETGGAGGTTALDWAAEAWGFGCRVSVASGGLCFFSVSRPF
jgi:hypothetical protein